MSDTDPDPRVNFRIITKVLVFAKNYPLYSFPIYCMSKK